MCGRPAGVPFELPPGWHYKSSFPVTVECAECGHIMESWTEPQPFWRSVALNRGLTFLDSKYLRLLSDLDEEIHIWVPADDGNTLSPLSASCFASPSPVPEGRVEGFIMPVHPGHSDHRAKIVAEQWGSD